MTDVEIVIPQFENDWFETIFKQENPPIVLIPLEICMKCCHFRRWCDRAFSPNTAGSDILSAKSFYVLISMDFESEILDTIIHAASF